MADDDGYVHRPDGEPEPADREREFGWRGWLLVGFLVVAFFVVPGILLALPHVAGTVANFGLGFRDAYLVLPLVPALVLGALAVWATTRP